MKMLINTPKNSLYQMALGNQVTIPDAKAYLKSEFYAMNESVYQFKAELTDTLDNYDLMQK